MTWKDLNHGKSSVSNLATRSQNVGPLFVATVSRFMILIPYLVHWFVNYELEKRFELARNTLEAIMGERPPELRLFHGTSVANINS
jgi:hypothetical protein